MGKDRQSQSSVNLKSNMLIEFSFKSNSKSTKRNIIYVESVWAVSVIEFDLLNKTINIIR